MTKLTPTISRMKKKDEGGEMKEREEG